MAIICSTRSLKYSPSLFFPRLLKHESISQKSSRFSTVKCLLSKSSVPVKYTTNKASKVEIAETIGFKKVPSPQDEPGDYRAYILVTGFAAFLIYFCILREENDIDEILKGDSEVAIKSKELCDLKIKLKFCEQNKLPTDALKAKIEELEKDRKVRSPFIK